MPAGNDFSHNKAQRNDGVAKTHDFTRRNSVRKRRNVQSWRPGFYTALREVNEDNLVICYYSHKNTEEHRNVYLKHYNLN